MHFIEILRERGLIHDESDQEGIRNLGPGDSFYVGFDPTARSLQIGNLVPLIVTLHLAKAGLKPIILFGGATGLIGDPSGKSEERKLLPEETIAQNVETQTLQVKTIFGRHGVEAQFVNNLDWMNELSVLKFLRDAGKYITVGYMLQKEVVKTRVADEGISFGEFSYMVLQAYDFLHLYTTENCKLQIGGSDQWGNITSGLELIRKKIHKPAYAFSAPLITDSSGKKFGKSEGKTLFLDAQITSPYKLHQFLLNADDKDVIAYLKIFTFLELQEIDRLEQALKSAPEKREAQKVLADTVCTFVHGEQATQDAKRSAEVLFGGSIAGLSESLLLDIFSEVPSSEVLRSELLEKTAIDILTETEMLKSKGEAKRLISSGGVYLNNERVKDPASSVADFLQDGSNVLIIRTGKKNYHLIKAV